MNENKQLRQQDRKSKERIKSELLREYKCHCFLCGQKFHKQLLTLHHIKKFEEVHETTKENSSILCHYCHFEIVNKVEESNKEAYNGLMTIVTEFKATQNKTTFN